MFDFKYKKHNFIYNNLVKLSRNVYFYKDINLDDKLENRIIIIFAHLAIILNCLKNSNTNKSISQELYDNIFLNLENNLREMGHGDVTVNKKMKEFNKISYDILLKINISNMKSFEMNFKLISSYFMVFDDEKCHKYIEFSNYFSKFYKYCFGLPLDNMLSKLLNFKY